MNFTESEWDEFREIVELGESQEEMDRIYSRLLWRKFAKRVYRENCDIIFELLKKELKER